MGVMTAPGLPLWSDHLRFVRRHRAGITVLMAVGLVVGFVWSLGQTTTWSATASVVLAPVPKYVSGSTGSLPPPPVTVDTDAQLLHSPRVLEAVATAIHTDPGSTIDHLSVAASPNSHVLHVTVTAGSAQAAADGAAAAVDALTEVRRSVLGSLRTDQLREVRLLIGRQQALLAAGAAVPVYSSLSAQVLALGTGLQELEDTRRRPAETVSPPVVPRHADRADTEVPLTSGVMVGLLCGCLLGAVRDRARPAATQPTRLQPTHLQPTHHHHEDHRHVT